MLSELCHSAKMVCWEYKKSTDELFIVSGIDSLPLYNGHQQLMLMDLPYALPPMIGNQLISQIRECIGTQSDFSTEVECDGSWYSIKADYHDDEPMVSGLINDITSEKTRELEMKADLEFSESIIAALPGVFYLLDEEGNYIRWNKNFEKVSGFSAEEILTGKPFENLADEHREYLTKRMDDLFQNGTASEELPLITKKGTKIPYFFTGKRLFLNGQQCLIGMGNDISELVKTRKKLEIAEQFAKIGYWELDQERLELTYWTQGMYDILETAPEDGMVPLEQIMTRIHDEDRHRFAYLISNIEQIDTQTLTLRYVTPRDTIKYINLSIFRNPNNPYTLEGVIQDITEVTLRDLKIKKIQERFNLIVQATTDAIFDWNPVTDYAWWSDSHYELFGYQKSDPLPGFEKWLEHIYHPDQDLVRNAVNEMISGIRTSWNEEIRLVGEDNQLKTLLVNCFTMGASKGIRILGSFIDISRQKQNEQALLDTNKRYELITKATQDGIWDWNISTDTITGNDRLRELYESKKQHLEINDFIERIHPEDRKRVESDLSSALNNRKNAITEEYRFKTKDHYRIIQDRAYIVYDENGAPKRMMGAMQDITMQRESERELQELSNRLLLATSAANLGIFDWKIEENHLVINEFTHEMFELNPIDFDHKIESLVQKIHPSDTSQLDFLHKAELQAYHHIRKTVRVLKSDGTLQHIELHMIVLRNESNNPESLIGVCRDITETINAEQQIAKAIIQTQEQERMETGQELHDNVIQTLVASMMNLTYAEDKIEGPKHLLANVKELISTAINDSRKLSHRLSPSYLINLRLDEAINNLISGLEGSGEIAFYTTYKLPKEAPITDELKLNIYRIVQEQISNIIKYAKASKVWVKVSEENNRVRLETKDNGNGFDVNQTKNGIGLNNISRRVKVFGGDIDIQSAPGKGCKIIIEIPYSNG
ncbi:PAS domain-containing protein [Marinoscillum furvescens]|nr:PAS domain-containing protein [Marinoscillum furvescens]